MAMIPTEPDYSRLLPWATKVEGLDDQAWERIAGRCAKLDQESVSGVLGRAELVARSAVPTTSPYAEPGLQPVLTAWFTGLGLVRELVALLTEGSPEHFERRAAQLRDRREPSSRDLGEAAFLSLQARAARLRVRHAGLAAALQAVGLAVLAGRRPDDNLKAVYAPFEPEIPFASLWPSEEHAA